MPSLQEAVKYWWKEALKQQTPCPITGMDVLQKGDSQVVFLTLTKSSPSQHAQDCATKHSITNDDDEELFRSGVEIPKIWYHASHMQVFAKILIESLQTGPDGAFKGVYSFADEAECEVYGGKLIFSFESQGMVTRLRSNKPKTIPEEPKTIPEGVIGFFDSSGKRQWVHHPKNLQLKDARVEYGTFLAFLSEELANIPNEHHFSPELHEGVAKVPGLVVPGGMDYAALKRLGMNRLLYVGFNGSIGRHLQSELSHLSRKLCFISLPFVSTLFCSNFVKAGLGGRRPTLGWGGVGWGGLGSQLILVAGRGGGVIINHSPPQFIFVICQATCHRTWLLGLRLLRSRPFSRSCSAFWEREVMKYRRIPKARGANILKLFYIIIMGVIINHSPIAVFKLTRVFTGKHTEIFKFNRKHNDA
jgi:hypothetical protein